MNHSSKESSVIAISSPEIWTHAHVSVAVDHLLNCFWKPSQMEVQGWGRKILHVSDLKAAVRTVIRAFLIFIPRTRFGYRWRCWCLNHVLIPFLNAFIHLYSLLNLSMHPIVLIDDTLSFHLSPHQTSEEIKAANKWYYVKCHSWQRIVRDRTNYYMLRTYIWYTYLSIIIYTTKILLMDEKTE